MGELSAALPGCMTETVQVRDGVLDDIGTQLCLIMARIWIFTRRSAPDVKSLASMPQNMGSATKKNHLLALTV